jgi:hypothetical protein
MATAAKSVVDSMREVVQDLLVPEMKAVKISIESLHKEMGYLRNEMILRDDKLEQAMRLGFENTTLAIRHLSDKLDYAGDLRERLAALEARVPRQ